LGDVQRVVLIAIAVALDAAIGYGGPHNINDIKSLALRQQHQDRQENSAVE